MDIYNLFLAAMCGAFFTFGTMAAIFAQLITAY